MFAFLGEWLDSSDGPALDASLRRFAHDAYDIADCAPTLPVSRSSWAATANGSSAPRPAMTRTRTRTTGDGAASASSSQVRPPRHAGPSAPNPSTSG